METSTKHCFVQASLNTYDNFVSGLVAFTYLVTNSLTN